MSASAPIWVEKNLEVGLVQVDKTKPLGKGSCHCAFARASRTVDGDKGGSAHQKRMIDQTGAAAAHRCSKE